MDVDDLPRIATDSDWLELREGERALLFGKLLVRTHPDTVRLFISNAAWEDFVVEVEDAVVPSMLELTPIRATVARIENGLRLVSIERIDL